MADGASGDFGRTLRTARERRGLSLRQIADATKIGVAVLEALERNDISRLPGGVFSRGIVRSFAVEVGLDPEQAIQDFAAQFSREAVAAGRAISSQAEDHLAVESDRHAATTFVRLMAISLPIAVAIVYFGSTGRPGLSSDAVRSAASQPIARESAASSTEAASSSPAVQVAATSGSSVSDRLRVTVSATRECWVSATVDGTKTLEGMLQPGDERVFEAELELELTAGDASALVLTLNGEAARPLGREGQTVTMRLNPNNYHEYVVAQ